MRKSQYCNTLITKIFIFCILDLAILIGLSFVSVKVMMEGIIHQMAQVNRQGISYRDMKGIRRQTKAGQDPETSNSGKWLPSGAEGKETVFLEFRENWNCGEGPASGSHGETQLLSEMQHQGRRGVQRKP